MNKKQLIIGLVLFLICNVSYSETIPLDNKKEPKFSYENVLFDEKNGDYYDVHVEYLQIIDKRIPQNTRQEVNNKIKKYVHSLFDKDLRSFRKSSKSIKEELKFSSTDSVSVSFKVIRLDERFLSVKFDKYFYGMGAAHGLEEITGFNYDIKERRFLKLEDFFKPKTNYLKQVSQYCINVLNKQFEAQQLKTKDYEVAYSWIKDGASPKKENLKEFGIGENELIIYFDVYQVTCYADGPQEVRIPFSKLIGFKEALF